MFLAEPMHLVYDIRDIGYGRFHRVYNCNGDDVLVVHWLVSWVILNPVWSITIPRHEHRLLTWFRSCHIVV